MQEVRIESISAPSGGKHTVRLSLEGTAFLIKSRIAIGFPMQIGDVLLVRCLLLEDGFSDPKNLKANALLSFATLDILEKRPSTDSFFSGYTVRRTLLSQIRRHFPEDAAALVSGILVGDGSLFSESLYASFRNSGLTHIMVVSGSNIAFLLAALLLLLRTFPRKIRLPIALGTLSLYCFFVGGDTPVIRACIMGMIAYIAIEF